MVESQEGEAKGNIEIFEFFLADAMKREYIEHYSNSLGKQMHMCIYGSCGGAASWFSNTGFKLPQL